MALSKLGTRIEPDLAPLMLRSRLGKPDVALDIFDYADHLASVGWNHNLPLSLAVSFPRGCYDTAQATELLKISRDDRLRDYTLKVNIRGGERERPDSYSLFKDVRDFAVSTLLSYPTGKTDIIIYESPSLRELVHFFFDDSLVTCPHQDEIPKLESL